ncbi:uncharacterized protein LOC132708189 [Cylas formicarius]|uniref:uncharacterized protein LOC132708189 n=1 Tax=Cylas formicarius TaxID=197179 RepID=UPI002958BF7B|nr:uncharacterized protein LOC132708189 [Cylas formicarius]
MRWEIVFHLLAKFNGKRLKPEWEENLPPGALVKRAKKGSTTNDLFMDFLRHLYPYKGPNTILLVLNGTASHLDTSITEVVDELNIRLFCLPSNITHELQPLDKAVYRAFEHHWDQEFGPENILSGFQTTIRRIPESAFAPSLATECPFAEEYDGNNANANNVNNDTQSNNCNDNIIDINMQSSDNSDHSEDDISLSMLKNIQEKVSNKIQNDERYETPVKTDNTISDKTQTQEESEDLN